MVDIGGEHIAGVLRPQSEWDSSLALLLGVGLALDEFLRYFPHPRAEARQDPDFKPFIGQPLASSVDVAPAPGSLEMSDFKLPIERLSEKKEAFRFEVMGDWWRARGPAVEDEVCEVEEPFVIDLEARRIGEGILLEGSICGRVSLECSRCAKRYPHSLRDEFRLVLEPAEGREPMDPEGVRGLAESGVCLGEDLEAGWFRGPLIRLDDFFGEVIALTMPLQPLCREDCAGICSHCGVDLAVTQCDCVDEQIDSPFAVLAKLKGKMENDAENDAEND